LFGIETLRALRVLLLCVIALGLALVTLSYGWTTLYPPAASWSPAQAAELAAVDAEVARLYKKLADAQLRGVQVPAEPVPLVRLLQKEAALRQEMEDALGASARTAKKLRLAGIALLSAGVAFYLYARSVARAS
jgi:drug/metabolite transporter (DMT)-like permease